MECNRCGTDCQNATDNECPKCGRTLDVKAEVKNKEVKKPK